MGVISRERGFACPERLVAQQPLMQILFHRFARQAFVVLSRKQSEFLAWWCD
jgi:hypothetical protein